MPEAADGQFFFTAERNGKMPHVQPGLYLSSIRFRTCKEAQLAIYVCKTIHRYDERTGVPLDAWYAIETPGLPVRFIRIFSGAEGLHDLLLRYAFHDAAGCVHEKHMQLRYSRTKETADRDVTSVVPAHLINALGVPQFYKESGNCWFASMLWVLFANTEMRNFCAERFALMNASEVAEWAREAFHVPEKAQKIRAFLWNKNRIGDDITAPPREDGKNGAASSSRSPTPTASRCSDEGREGPDGCLRIWKKCRARRSSTTCSSSAAKTWITTDACRSRNSFEKETPPTSSSGGSSANASAGTSRASRTSRETPGR